jgi:hypothetical protein
VSSGIEEQPVIHQNAAFVGTGKSRQTIQYQALTCPAWAEQNGDAGIGAQLHVKLEWIRVADGRKPLNQASVNAHTGVPIKDFGTRA